MSGLPFSSWHLYLYSGTAHCIEHETLSRHSQERANAAEQHRIACSKSLGE